MPAEDAYGDGSLASSPAQASKCKKRLNKITAAEIERAYAQLKAKKNLSGTTLNKLHILLKSVFEKACDYDLILRNPCNKVESPSVDKPDRKSLTQEEGATLLHKLDMEEARIVQEMEKEERQVKKGNQFGRSSIRGLANLGYTIGTRIALATGLRRGEVFGLTWKNVNLRQNTITVAQTLTKEGEMKDPKTGAGRRTISIDENTAAHLKMWRKRQRKELTKLAMKLSDATPVCCSERGEWVNFANFELWCTDSRPPGTVGTRSSWCASSRPPASPAPRTPHRTGRSAQSPGRCRNRP